MGLVGLLGMGGLMLMGEWGELRRGNDGEKRGVCVDQAEG